MYVVIPVNYTIVYLNIPFWEHSDYLLFLNLGLFQTVNDQQKCTYCSFLSIVKKYCDYMYHISHLGKVYIFCSFLKRLHFYISFTKKRFCKEPSGKAFFRTEVLKLVHSGPSNRSDFIHSSPGTNTEMKKTWTTWESLRTVKYHLPKRTKSSAPMNPFWLLNIWEHSFYFTWRMQLNPKGHYTGPPFNSSLAWGTTQHSELYNILNDINWRTIRLEVFKANPPVWYVPQYSSDIMRTNKKLQKA